tara:strand:+ start:271 stop:702 length:432 start_codon:yes stop_codon:yes gene_type:complete
MKTYCSKCGHPNAYTVKKPKFCNECGQNLSISAATSKSTSATPHRKETIVIEEEEGLEVEIEQDSIPTIDALDVEIETGKVTGVQLGQVVEAGAEGGVYEPTTQEKGKKGRKMSKKAKEQFNKQVLDDLQSEAGAIRRRERSD